MNTNKTYEGFQFIAKDSIDRDSVSVPAAVNTSGGIPTGPVQINPGSRAEGVIPDILGKALEDHRKRRSLPFFDKQPVFEGVKQGGAANLITEAISGPEDFAFGIGEVLITQSEDSLDHFTVMFEPDTIGLGDSSVITIIAKNEEDEEILLSDSTLLMLTVDSLEKGFGEFISNSGDTLLLPFDNLLYEDARRGRIKYHSNDTLNLDNQPYLINPVVSRKDNSTQNGTGQLVIHQADTILVMVVQDTIAHVDSAIIKIQAQDKNGLDVHLPYSTLISLTLDTAGVKYGSF